MDKSGEEKVQIAASILSADFSRLGEQVEEALLTGIRWIHVDVMDGHFVPNLSMGTQVVRSLRPIADKFGSKVHVHLMITEPDRYMASFARAGADSLSVHVEAGTHLCRTIHEMRALGVRAGVALNPATPLVALDEILGELDLVLVMTVEPGFGGQEFIPYGVDKIARLKRILVERGLDQVLIAVDGGIHTGTAASVVTAGAAVLVVGSGIFNAQASVAENLRGLRAAIATADLPRVQEGTEMHGRNRTLPRFEIFRDHQALVQAAADKIVRLCAKAIEEKKRFAVALSGGSTPSPLYGLLAGKFARSIDWSRVHLFWGDERCVPPNDPRSNYRMVKEALLDKVSIPPANVHPIDGDEEPYAGAAAYERELRSFFGSHREDGPPAVGFDLILLGMGENGHTASLFPGLPAVTERVRWVMAQYVEVVSMWRITLTPVVINGAEHIFFLVSGADKAEAAARVLEGPIQPEVLPAQAIRPAHGRLLWLMDDAAALRLAKENLKQPP